MVLGCSGSRDHTETFGWHDRSIRKLKKDEAKENGSGFKKICHGESGMPI